MVHGSFKDLMNAISYISITIAYAGSHISRTYVDQDLLWGYADGLYQKRIQNILNRRCSDQTFLDFDMNTEIISMTKDCDSFVSHLKQFPEEYTNDRVCSL